MAYSFLEGYRTSLRRKNMGQSSTPATDSYVQGEKPWLRNYEATGKIIAPQNTKELVAQQLFNDLRRLTKIQIERAKLLGNIDPETGDISPNTPRNVLDIIIADKTRQWERLRQDQGIISPKPFTRSRMI